MAQHYLEFEKPLLEIAERIEALRAAQESGQQGAIKDTAAEIERLEVKQARVTRLVYRELSPAQKVQIARHPDRPQGADYIKTLVTDFVEISGDRRFGRDSAIIAGFGKWQGKTPVAVVAIDKGKTTKERIEKNFGMPKPEGYRTAQRLMEMASRFGLPLVTLVDTPGAYPGLEAEERGQAEAIAASVAELLNVQTPIISVITGEGGSGGALALAVADEVLMLEHSIYSVISPEGCAAILWKEANKETIPAAAAALQLTAQDLHRLKVIDGIIKEPVGAAHRDHTLTLSRVGDTVAAALLRLKGQANQQTRRQKFLQLGMDGGEVKPAKKPQKQGAKTMKTLQTAVLATLLATTAIVAPAMAQEAKEGSAYWQSVTVVNLTGDARRKVAPDRVSAALTANEVEATATAAQAKVNAKAQLVKAAVGKVPGVKLTTSSYNVYRTNDGWIINDKGQRIRSGKEEWQANQTFTLDSMDPATLQKLVGTLQEQGLQLQGFNFYLSREATDKLTEELTSEAVASVKTRAAKMASNLGLPGIRIARIDVNGGGYQPPMPYARAEMMMAKSADAGMPAPVAEPDQIEVNVSINAEVHLK